MRVKNIALLLVISGIIGIAAGLWSQTGSGLGPVRMGKVSIDSESRNIIMYLTLIGAVGALILAGIVKRLGNKIIGVSSLVLGGLMVPSLAQANILSIISILLLLIVGLTLLIFPSIR